METRPPNIFTHVASAARRVGAERHPENIYRSIDFYNILHKVFTLGWDVKVGMLVKSWRSESEISLESFTHCVSTRQSTVGWNTVDWCCAKTETRSQSFLKWLTSCSKRHFSGCHDHEIYMFKVCFTFQKQQVHQVGQIKPCDDPWCHFVQPVLEWYVTVTHFNHI